MADWLDGLLEAKEQEKRESHQRTVQNQALIDNVWPTVVTLVNESCDFLRQQGVTAEVNSEKVDGRSPDMPWIALRVGSFSIQFRVQPVHNAISNGEPWLFTHSPWSRSGLGQRVADFRDDRLKEDLREFIRRVL